MNADVAQPVVSADLVVAELLARWPQAIPVLIGRRLICPGCAMSRFETLAEIAANYGLALDDLLSELRQAVQPETDLDKETTTMADPAILDVRALAPAQRHPLIFQTFEALPRGEAFILVNDHDPKPLYYQFKFEREGKFTWDYLESGPVVWRVRIGRSAPGA